MSSTNDGSPFKDTKANYDKFKEHLPAGITNGGELAQHANEFFAELIAAGKRTAPMNFIKSLGAEFQIPEATLTEAFEDVKSVAAKQKADAKAIATATPSGALDALSLYGLNLDQTGYYISDQGVGIMRGECAQCVTSRTIYVSAVGEDPVTSTVHVLVRWLDSHGQWRTKWVLRTALTDREELRNLIDAPIDLQNIAPVSAWLVASCGYLSDECKGVMIVSRPGWTTTPVGRRFMLPTSPGVQTLSGTSGSRGSLPEWVKGLQLLISMGIAGFPALIALSLSIIAPLVEFAGKRNPVLAIICSTSQGKGTMFVYALSVYTDPTLLTLVGVDMTVKGLQDRARENTGLPVWVDEFQSLLDVSRQRGEQVLYFLANGITRVTSSKAKVSSGGLPYKGVAFVAAETPILDGMHGGAQFRVISLEVAPLQSREQADFLQGLARDHYGTLGPILAPFLDAYQPTVAATVQAGASRWFARYPDLKGDDPFTIAFVELGLQILSEATGYQMPIDDIAAWLAGRCGQQRTGTIDKATATFDAMIDVVLSSEFGVVTGADKTKGVTRQDQTLWWALADGGVDVNPAHPWIASVFKEHGGDRHAATWHSRGWILKQQEHLKCRRADIPNRVYRVVPWAINRDGVQP